MDPGLGELVLRVSGLWIASGSLFSSPVTSGSSKMSGRYRILVYRL